MEIGTPRWLHMALVCPSDVIVTPCKLFYSPRAASLSASCPPITRFLSKHQLLMHLVWFAICHEVYPNTICTNDEIHAQLHVGNTIWNPIPQLLLLIAVKSYQCMSWVAWAHPVEYSSPILETYGHWLILTNQICSWLQRKSWCWWRDIAWISTR